MTSFANREVGADDVVDLFKIILGRTVPTDDSFVQSTVAAKSSFERVLPQFLNSKEFKTKFERANRQAEAVNEAATWQELRNPKGLHVTPCTVRKVLMIGSCLLTKWTDVLRKSHALDIDFINTNNGSQLPDLDEAAISSFQLQIVQIPLRAVFHEGQYYGLRHDDDAGWQKVFAHSCQSIDRILSANMRYNREHGLLTFVLNFVRPQQNFAGKLMPKYHLSNPDYFVSELNRHLDARVRTLTNAHMVDFDQICANFGRHWIGEDRVIHYSHGSLLSPARIEAGTPRIVPELTVSTLTPIKTDELIATVFDEILELNRIIRQQDSIKIVIFDLDDTLWRGIAAEVDDPTDSGLTEGWPLGLVEAISFLWKRGILVAICSKNDQSIAEKVWALQYGKKFPIENFVVRKINWQSKSENIREILEAVNLLPGNALFVDDNPAERAKVKESFPDIRVLEGPLLEWRRTLLWAAELQQAHVSAESISRTETIKAQIERTSMAAQLSPEEYLAGLGVTIAPRVIKAVDDPAFNRAFELLNKTNQFNTTGRRWTMTEMTSFLSDGGSMFAVSVEDKHANYGLTAIALIGKGCIEQVVMSCRVFGMGIEQALCALALREIHSVTSGDEVRAWLTDTGKNRLTHNYFAEAGFVRGADGLWHAKLDGLPHASREVPKHIQITPEQVEA